jgi:hypothetical protein
MWNDMKTMHIVLSAIVAVAVAACGGGKSSGKGTTEPGSTHETTGGGGAGGGGGGGESGGGEMAPPDAGLPPDAAPPPKPKAPVTFILKNQGATELQFPLDKGWSAVIFAYTGKPPKAKSINVFDKFCTASCDADQACPICEAPDDPIERHKAEKAETKRQVVAAGETFELDWDGLSYDYEKAPKDKRGKNKTCQCWKKAPPPAGTYTIKACGLRTATELGQTSKFECAETTVDLPVAEGQTVDVTLVFTGKPPEKKPGK